jgi:hypothetical protein
LIVGILPEYYGIFIVGIFDEWCYEDLHRQITHDWDKGYLRKGSADKLFLNADHQGFFPGGKM